MEAPHLSALHKKYAGRGLVVLAVNAWNEPKLEVARYLRNNRLSQRVLLGGAEVGMSSYGVTALPENFWIDKAGVIIHRLSGFSEHDVKTMEKWIEEML